MFFTLPPPQLQLIPNPLSHPVRYCLIGWRHQKIIGVRTRVAADHHGAAYSSFDSLLYDDALAPVRPRVINKRDSVGSVEKKDRTGLWINFDNSSAEQHLIMLSAADGKEKYTFPFAYGSGLKTAPNAPYTATASPSITRPVLSTSSSSSSIREKRTSPWSRPKQEAAAGVASWRVFAYYWKETRGADVGQWGTDASAGNGDGSVVTLHCCYVCSSSSHCVTHRWAAACIAWAMTIPSIHQNDPSFTSSTSVDCCGEIVLSTGHVLPLCVGCYSSDGANKISDNFLLVNDKYDQITWRNSRRQLFTQYDRPGTVWPEMMCVEQ